MPEITVTTDGTTPVLTADSTRRVLKIQNQDPERSVYVRLGKPVASSGTALGFQLKPEGGSEVVSSSEDGGAAGLALYAATASGTAKLYVEGLTTADLPG